MADLEVEDQIFDNKPIKDKYSVSGSDMAQIGWIEVTTRTELQGTYGTDLSMRLVYASRIP